jgi:N-acetylmuramic acid 6-phosphate (MurNAc-6-P) etherase
MMEAGIDERAAGESLEKANGSLPSALLMGKTGCSLEEAERALAAAGGVVSRAEEILSKQEL